MKMIYTQFWVNLGLFNINPTKNQEETADMCASGGEMLADKNLRKL